MTPDICLAAAIFFEAGVEPTEGKYAVGQVVLNRVEDHRYPDTVCGVVYEANAFSFTHDGKSDKIPKGINAESSKEVASDLLSNVTYPITSTHYHANYVDPYWNKHFTKDITIGNHIFYTNKTKYK